MVDCPPERPQDDPQEGVILVSVKELGDPEPPIEDPGDAEVPAPDDKNAPGSRTRIICCPLSDCLPSPGFSCVFVIFLLVVIIMLLVMPPVYCGILEGPCKSCVKTVRLENKIQQTLVYLTKYPCKGVKKSCVLKNTTYTACIEDATVTCYDPQESPIQWWFEVRTSNLKLERGPLLIRTRLPGPNVRVNFTVEFCKSVVAWPYCGDLMWQRYYSTLGKYVCPGKTPDSPRWKHDCQFAKGGGWPCSTWECVLGATWFAPNPEAEIVITNVPVSASCSATQCNYVNISIKDPQSYISTYGRYVGMGIDGKGKDPLGVFHIHIAQLSELETYTKHAIFYSDFWEEMAIPFKVPEAARNLFTTFAETVASSLNVSNCYVCGGTQVGDQWPWEAAEMNVSEPYTEINQTNPHSQWMLKSVIVSRWCVQRFAKRAPQIGHIPCETATIINGTNNITYWPNSSVIPVNRLWPAELKNKLRPRVQGSRVGNKTKSTWKAPRGLYWICGKYAYSELPEPWEGACTLGEIRPSFFLIPLSEGVRLGHPVYAKRSTIAIGNWADNEWPPERIIQYYGPATWAQDGSWGYRTPVYMLNRIIRLQAVLEIITNETARALTTLSKTQTQLRNAVYQNRLALDYLLAAEGGVCGKFNLTNCCLQIDDNGKVIEEISDKIVKLAHVPVQKWEGFQWDGMDTWLGWLGGLKGLIGIVGVGILLCIFLPCLLPLIIQGVKGMMEEIADKRSALHLMALHEYRLLPSREAAQSSF